MKNSVFQVLQLGRETLKMTVTRLDPAIDMSKIRITFDTPSAKELEEAHMTTTDDDAYKRCRAGFAAFKE